MIKKKKICPDQHTNFILWKNILNVTNDFYVPISIECFSIFSLPDLKIFDINSYSIDITLHSWLL